MKAHFSRTVSSCFNIRRSAPSVDLSHARFSSHLLKVDRELDMERPATVLSRLDYRNASLAGLPARELSRLQSVQNASARLIFWANKYDHVPSLLRDLHWLRALQRIDYKIAALVYRCLHGLATAYLSVDLQSIKDLPLRQRLRSWSSDTLAVPTSNLSDVDDRAFPIVAARIWNTLSQDVPYPVLCQLSSVGPRPSFSHGASVTDVTA